MVCCTQTGVVLSRFFAGLPSPMAGSCVAAVVFTFPRPVDAWPVTVLVALGVAATALLMVSRLRYRSFREIDLRNPRSYLVIVPLAAESSAACQRR